MSTFSGLGQMARPNFISFIPTEPNNPDAPPPPPPAPNPAAGTPSIGGLNSLLSQGGSLSASPAELSSSLTNILGVMSGSLPGTNLGSGFGVQSRQPNVVNGIGGSVLGQSNRVTGDKNNIRGDNNTVIGEDNKVVGENNQVTGTGNKVVGRNNRVTGNGVEITGDNQVFPPPTKQPGNRSQKAASPPTGGNGPRRANVPQSTRPASKSANPAATKAPASPRSATGGAASASKK